MTLRNTLLTALGFLALLNSPSTIAAKAATSDASCAQIAPFYSSISAESEQWQRSLLDSLSEPVDACEELKLGLLLSHPVVVFQNDAAALNALSHALILLPDHAVDKSTLSMLIDHIEERQTLRNMLGDRSFELAKSNRRLNQRQRHIDTLRGQIDQLKNLEAQLEDKARAAIEPDTELDPAPESDAQDEQQAPNDSQIAPEEAPTKE